MFPNKSGKWGALGLTVHHFFGLRTLFQGAIYFQGFRGNIDVVLRPTCKAFITAYMDAVREKEVQLVVQAGGVHFPNKKEQK
jgi:hypothetical protein